MVNMMNKTEGKQFEIMLTIRGQIHGLVNTSCTLYFVIDSGNE